ncbi:MAG TPA: hypothetical protein PKL77_06590 [Candidatus Omnitrophota bacterium]|nr:hypothetical protein [Candidatus Omnitrophota bacterium]HPT07932.1 hypothetical protein [Candidatus Omnitrophota bacterium]
MKFVFICVMFAIFPSIAVAQEDPALNNTAGVDFRSSQGHTFKVPEDMIVVKHPGYVVLLPVDEYLGMKVLQYDDRFRKMQETIDSLQTQVVELKQQVETLQTEKELAQNSNQTVPSQ